MSELSHDDSDSGFLYNGQCTRTTTLQRARLGAVSITNPTRTTSIRGEMRSAVQAPHLRLDVGAETTGRRHLTDHVRLFYIDIPGLVLCGATI
jgi:hypothetical protein